MARPKVTTVKESIEELKKYRSQVTSYRSSKKLDFLLLFCEFPDTSVLEASKRLQIGTSTITRWFHHYKESGLESFLASFTRKRTSKIITPAIHEALESKLRNPKASFSGYKDAQQWVEQEFGVQIHYLALWRYMTNKLESKLKVPRKSNIKKDKEAEAEFFKTT